MKTMFGFSAFIRSLLLVLQVVNAESVAAEIKVACLSFIVNRIYQQTLDLQGKGSEIE